MDLCEEKIPKKYVQADLAGLSEASQGLQSKPTGAEKMRGKDGTPTSRAQYQRRWKLLHPEKVIEYQKRSAPYKKQWLERNPEKRRQVALDWYYRNRPPLKVRVLKETRVARRCRQRRKTSIQFCLADRLRSTLNRALRRHWVKKSQRTMDLVGCSVEELKIHIESQFTPEMTWANRNTWHVDHHVPVSAFDLRDKEERMWAFNWRNLRPLNGRENQRKQAKLPDPLPSWLPPHIAQRILERSAPCAN